MKRRQPTVRSLATIAAHFVLAVGIVFCACDTPVESPPPPPTPPTLTEQLDDILSDTLQARGGTGVSAAVLMPGPERWIGASGVSYGSVHITPQMLFGASSNTKTYVAALTLKLVEAGLLTLEDSLHQWLGDYQHIDSTITVRQLLNHTSGVYDFITFPGAWATILNDPSRAWTPDEILASLVDAPYFSPGSDFHYSNTGYLLVGMVMESATGSSVSTELRSRLWEPLGLANTFFDVEEPVIGELAHAWVSDGSTLVDISVDPRTAASSATWTAGAVFTTAEELAEWGHALYGGGVLSAASFAEMTFDPGAGFGLGVDLELGQAFFSGERVLGFAASGLGYSSVLAFLQDHDICISVMINDNNLDCMFAMAGALVNAVLAHLS